MYCARETIPTAKPQTVMQMFPSVTVLKLKTSAALRSEARSNASSVLLSPPVESAFDQLDNWMMPRFRLPLSPTDANFLVKKYCSDIAVSNQRQNTGKYRIRTSVYEVGCFNGVPIGIGVIKVFLL